MKIYFVIPAIILFFNLSFVYSQNSKLDEIINNHIFNFREEFAGEEATIFVESYYDFLKREITFKKNDFVIEACFDAKKLKKNKDYYLIRFIVSYDDDILKLNAVHFRIEKKNNRTINMINLLNGKSYKLD